MFDRSYFQRFYETPSTRVHGRREVNHLARGVANLVDWFGGRIESVLDVGAGVGFWRDWFLRQRPSVRYVSTDVSPYACEHYGHQLRDISKWRARQRFDLIVCQGVLPYLPDVECEAAIENIAAMSRGFLYLEAVTAHDLQIVCDRSKTDVAVHPRTGAWYRQRLGRSFAQIGGGLWYLKDGPQLFYELECAGAV